MVKISAGDIKPTGAPGVSGITGDNDGLPKWFNRIEGIAKEINKMFEAYYSLSGKSPPGQDKKPETMDAIIDNKPSFSEAREAKKLQMAGQQNAKKEVIIMPDKIQELLAGLVKTTKNLQAMGYGERTIGEVIASAPYTVDQVAAFLADLYKKHYGG